MDNALFNRGDEIAEGWAASLTMGVGQFCTNPGVVVLREGPAANRFVDVAKSALDSVPAQTMLNEGIAKAYRTGQSRLEATKGVTNLLSTPSDTTQAGPALFATNAQTWQQDTALREEVFGPLGLIVTAASMEEVKDVAKSLEGQLTCTLMLDDDDIENASELMPVLERKAGRVLANGFPTGCRGIRRDGSRRPLPGLDKLWGDISRNNGDQAFLAPCLLSKPARNVAPQRRLT